MTDAHLNHELDTEPARMIGDIFADKAMVKTWVTAAVGIISLTLRVTADDQVIEDVTTLVTMLATVGTVLMAQYEQKQRAKAQAEETRAHVYAPATVEKIIETHGKVIA